MTKQEEIREGIDRIIQHWSPLTSTSADWAPLYGGITVGQDTQLYLHSQGVVLKVEGELPEFTNNMGCMGKTEIEDFASFVLWECGHLHKMRWTTAGDILIGDIIYIDERHIDAYPWEAKLIVLHEVAHIDTWPQDDKHGVMFHLRLAELINRFMAYSATEPLI